MEVVADLHLHSKYSRAVSPQMILPVMAHYAKRKGISLLTTGDFTHPLWFREIQAQLDEKNEGIYQLKNIPSTGSGQAKENDPYFLLSTEISSIYKEGEKLRRIHNLLFAPNFSVVQKINAELLKRGCNISSDGRPIVGLSCRQILELALSIDKKVILIPCHVWTPHFGLYGSASGYESIEEAFGSLSKYVYGIETGISSDPFMNWQIPELEKRAILSFSDAHSPAKMAREATVFTLQKLTYMNIGKAIARPDETAKIAYTIEFYPEEGKYHYSGHRNCKVSLSPSEIAEKGNICPVCNRKVTEGVMARVQQVANREISTSEPSLEPDEAGMGWIKDPKGIHPPFVKLVPLLEIVAESLDSTVSSEKSKILFNKLCDELGSELEVLLKSSLSDIQKVGGKKVSEGVSKVRKGTIAIEPGYDGEYGKVAIWDQNEEKKEESEEIFGPKEDPKEQMGLF